MTGSHNMHLSADRPETKRCSRCGERKALDEFRRCRSAADGRQTYCRPCQIEVNRLYSERTPEWNKNRWAAAYAKHGSAILAQRQRWRELNREKTRAHKAVYRALKSGRLIRPSTCEYCGIEGPTQAHHDDYRCRLEVRWLCSRCHGRVHRDEALAA